METKMKIVIADDERRIREGLVRHITKMGDNYHVEKVFSNGKDLLEYLQTNEADIAIVDIKMPLVDGMEVSREIRSRWPMTKVIILSGYCEFSYAKASIQCGVSDYLVKPLKPEELRKTLEKVSEEIAKRWQEKRSQEQLVGQYRVQILQAWLNDVDDRVNVKDTHFFSSNMCKYRVLYAEGNTDELLRILQELPYVSCRFQYYPLVQERACIFMEAVKTDEPDPIIDLIFPERCSFTVGIGDWRTEEASLPEACREALVSCKRNWYEDKRIFFEGKEHFAAAEKSISIQFLEETAAAIFSCDKELYENKMDELKAAVWESRMNILSTRKMMLQILQEVNRKAERMGIVERQQSWKEMLDVLDIDGFDSIFLKADEYFMRIQKDLEQIISYRSGKKIKQVIFYIEEHLTENIALQDVCDYVGISSGYLSRIFKEKTGYNFVDYVNRKKIEKAKDMLAKSDMTSVEIADFLSFNDDKYFIRLFKKLVGMTPGAYRKVSR